MTLVTADTSVVVPALLDWHEHHDVAAPAISEVRRLPGHVLAEAYSVLTRLPHGLSLRGDEAADLLISAFPGPPLTLGAADYVRVLTDLASAGLRGGAVYDAVVAASAATESAELLTLDARASGTYRAVGARFRSP